MFPSARSLRRTAAGPHATKASSLTQETDKKRAALLDGWPKPVQWTALVALSAALAAGLELVGIPAGFLLGPMIVGIAAGTSGARIRVAQTPYTYAQAVVGCLIANSITPGIVLTFLDDWPLFIALVTAVIAASSVLGWLMSRWQVLPGSTAVWGASPGGATAMMLMAEAFGADARLVAFMQYARVVMVALAASIISRIFVQASGGQAPLPDLLQPVDWLHLCETILLVVAGSSLGAFLRIPAGPLLVPLAIGSALHALGIASFALPVWLLAPSYALIGWRVGLSFTRDVLSDAARALPRVLGSILLLLVFCGGLAFILHRAVGIDPLSAYLATSPGGMDSIAIISASSNVDLPFVMTLQTVRFVMVLVVGPASARFLARHSRHGAPASSGSRE